MLTREKLINICNEGNIDEREILDFYATTEYGKAGYNNAMNDYTRMYRDKDFDFELVDLGRLEAEESFELPNGTEVYPDDDIYAIVKIEEEEEEEEVTYNTYNPLFEETETYDNKYENREVKYTRVKFADNDYYTTFENKDYGKDQVKSTWINIETGKPYLGIIEANPTAVMANFSNFEISTDMKKWTLVSDLVEKEVK